MAGDKEAKVVVGVEGAEQVAAAADKALGPWKRYSSEIGAGFSKVGTTASGALRNIGQQIGQVASDLIRTATVMRGLSLAGTINEARTYREEIARFGVMASGALAGAGVQMQVLSKRTLESEPALVAWSKSVGRLTYDYNGAVQSAAALHDEAVATGKSFDEMGGLGVTLHNALGVSGDVSSELAKIRGQADALGNAGGVSAFQDQLQALDSTLTQFATHSAEARNALTALVGELGKGYSAPQQQQIQHAILGGLTSKRELIRHETGVDILNEKGEVDAQKLGAALPKIQKFAKRTVGKRWQHQLYKSWFGSDLAASAFENGNFSPEELARVANAKPDNGAKVAADKFAATPAGQALDKHLEAQRNARDAAGGLVEAQDWWTKKFAEHPILGAAAGFGAQALGGLGAGLLGKLIGGGLGGAGAAAGGAAAGAELVAAGTVAGGEITVAGATAAAALVAGATAAGIAFRQIVAGTNVPGGAGSVGGAAGGAVGAGAAGDAGGGDAGGGFFARTPLGRVLHGKLPYTREMLEHPIDYLRGPSTPPAAVTSSATAPGQATSGLDDAQVQKLAQAFAAELQRVTLKTQNVATVGPPQTTKPAKGGN